MPAAQVVTPVDTAPCLGQPQDCCCRPPGCAVWMTKRSPVGERKSPWRKEFERAGGGMKRRRKEEPDPPTKKLFCARLCCRGSLERDPWVAPSRCLKLLARSIWIVFPQVSSFLFHLPCGSPERIHQSGRFSSPTGRFSSRLLSLQVSWPLYHNFLNFLTIANCPAACLDL